MAAVVTAASRVPDARRTLLATHGEFRRYWVAFGLSLHGTWIQNVAYGWLLHSLTGSAAWLGAAAFLGSVPWVPLVFVSGSLGDRYSKRKLLIATNSLACLQALALAAVVASGHVQVWHLIAGGMVLGAANALESSSRIVFATRLLPAGHTAAAVSLIWATAAAAQLAGPAAGGLLLEGMGAAACFGVNALTFLVLIGALTSISEQPIDPLPALSEAREQSPWALVRGGGIAALLTLTAVIGAFGASIVTFLPVFAGELGLGPTGLGALYASYGAGALAGGLAASSWSRVGAGHVALVATAVGGCGLVALALAGGPLMASAALALVGGSVALVSVLVVTMIQDVSPLYVQARMASIQSLVSTAAIRIGALVMGFSAAAFGLWPVVIICGVCLALAVPLVAKLAPVLLTLTSREARVS